MDTKESMKKEIDNIDSKIDELSLVGVQAIHKDSAEALTRKKEDLKAEWDEMKEESEEAWGKVRDNFQSKISLLNSSYEDLKKKI